MNGDAPGDRRQHGSPGPPERGAGRPTPPAPSGGAFFPDDTTDDVSTLDDELDPRLSGLFTRAFVRPVAVEVAARHLWVIDREATRLAQERAEPRGLRRVLVAGLAALALMTTSTAAVAASGPAMPGDLLYPVKLGSEQARLLVARSPEAEALVLLDIAANRIAEAEHAAEDRPDEVDGLLRQAATAFTAAAAVSVESPDVTAATEEVRRSVSDAGQRLAPSPTTNGPAEVDDSVTVPPTPAAEPAPTAAGAPPVVVPPPPRPGGGGTGAVVPPPIPAETSVPAVPPSDPTEPSAPAVPALPETGTASGSEQPSPSPSPTPSPSDESIPPPPPPPPVPSAIPDARPTTDATDDGGQGLREPQGRGPDAPSVLPSPAPAVEVPRWRLEEADRVDR